MQELTTLEQRVVKIKFYLNQTAQNIIEVGKELTAAKQEVPHGQWQAWLQDNFQLSQSSANKFMQCAERFGKSESIPILRTAHMIQLLTLPEGETENFIAKKAAEGTPVEEMTVKKLREEIQQFKRDNYALNNELQRIYSVNKANVTRANRAESRLQDLFADIDKLKAENSALKKQKPLTVEPADYRQLKKAKEQLQIKITALQKELAKKTVEVVPPADYDATKKELAQLQAAQSEMVQRMEVFQNLGTIATLIEYVIKSPSSAGIQDFKREHPEEFGKMCAAFLDFTDSFYKE